jgi:WD40 repeat protein
VAAVEQVGVLGWQRVGEQWVAMALPTEVAGTGQAVAFSRDGSTLATSSATRRVDLWTVAGSGLTPLPPIELTDWADNQQALSLVFAPNGELVMGLKSHQVQFYALSAGGGATLVRVIEGFGNYVNGISISDDGNRLATAGSDNTVREFDLRAPDLDEPRIWHGPSTFTSVAYVGGEVVATADDGVVTAWQSTHPVMRLGSETIFQIPAGSRSPDILAGSGPSGEITRLRVSDGPNLVRVGPELAPPPDASFSGAIGISASGRLAVLGSADGTVFFGDYSDTRRPKLVGPGVRALQTLNETVDINEARSIAVTGGLESPRLPVIDVSDLSAPEVVSTIDVGEGVTWASLSPDGTSVAFATPGGAVLLYDLTDPARPAQLMTIKAFDTAALAVRFRPDGHALLATSSTKELVTIDITRRSTPEITARLSGPVGQIYSGAYSSDGDMIVVGGGAGEIWTWDVTDERRPDLRVVLRAFGGKVFDVRFADDDRTVLAAGDGGAVMSWTVDADLMLDRACRGAGAQITEAEWRQYLPGSPYDPPCED